APAVALMVEQPLRGLEGCRAVEVDLAHLDRIDGSGAVLLARLLDRLDASGPRTRIVENTNPEAARLIALYRTPHEGHPVTPARRVTTMGRIGAVAAQLPDTVNAALDFTGHCA